MIVSEKPVTSDLTDLKQNKKKLLHVGCGQSRGIPHPYFNYEEWQDIRLDINAQFSPDIVCDMTNMRGLVEDEIYDGLFSSHNIEHVFKHQVVPTLSEFRRVLRIGGVLLITLPDLQSVMEKVMSQDGDLESVLYTSPAGPITGLDILYGYTPQIAMGNHFMAHKTGFTLRSLAKSLACAGFRDISIFRDNHYNLWARAYNHGSQPDNAQVKVKVENFF